MIVADTVEIKYTKGKRSFLALEDVTFSVNKGEKFVVIGTSGCGKTSLLKAIAGFLPITGGTLLVDNQPVISPSKDRMVVFQESDQLFPWKTVLENVAYAIAMTNGTRVFSGDVIHQAKHYLSLVGIEGAAGKYPHQLSGGMKQRAAIARALAVRPKILLLDEPFAALDEISRWQMQQELNQIWQQTGVTIVLITHSLQEAIYLGDWVLVLSPSPGKVIEVIDTSELDDIHSQHFIQVASHLRYLLSHPSRSYYEPHYAVA